MVEIMNVLYEINPYVETVISCRFWCYQLFNVSANL